MSADFGILAWGAYIPRLRLQRKAVAAANSWFAPGLRGLAKGERAMANWDEDAITMGTEAARDCLTGFDRAHLGSVTLASTTHPFDDRQNVGVIANALNLSSGVRSMDVSGSLRAASSALIAALRADATSAPALVIGADQRKAKAASTQELQYGDGAAAMLVGRGRVVARLLATHTETVDFVHQFRFHDREHDYAWEERWVRDEGFLKIVPAAVQALLAQGNVPAASITHFCMPSTLSRIGAAVAKKCGLPEGAVRDTLAANCGDTGAAHSLLMLADALEQSKAGDRILVASFGQGCDALLFEVTEAIAALPARNGVKGSLARRHEENNYMKFLAFNGTLDLERGMRAEVDKQTPLSTHYRNRDMVQGLIGGKCRKCGTLQYPRGRYCVNPECKQLDSQDDQPFADKQGQVMSYTVDVLTYSPDPPAFYGMVRFNEGGRMLADFTDMEEAVLDVGLPLQMVFRIKDVDPMRGFQRYFWKAAPVNGSPAEGSPVQGRGAGDGNGNS